MLLLGLQVLDNIFFPSLKIPRTRDDLQQRLRSSNALAPSSLVRTLRSGSVDKSVSQNKSVRTLQHHGRG